MISDVTLRLATPADAAEIAALSRDEIEQGLPWRWREARVLRAIASRDTNVAVAAAQSIAAFGIMAYHDDDAHLLLFAVRPSHRRRRIGSALLAWLEDVARTATNRRVVVEARWSNAAARGFYAEHGYHETALCKGMYCGIEDGVRLEKWLTSA
jgi:[ribosomal protein S18]-alanine N-acetyltransferase